MKRGIYRYKLPLDLEPVDMEVLASNERNVIIVPVAWKDYHLGLPCGPVDAPIQVVSIEDFSEWYELKND